MKLLGPVGLIALVFACGEVEPDGGAPGGSSGATGTGGVGGSAGDAITIDCQGLDESACVAAEYCIPGYGNWAGSSKTQYGGCIAVSEPCGATMTCACGASMTCAVNRTSGRCFEFNDDCIPDGWRRVDCRCPVPAGGAGGQAQEHD